MSEPDRKTNRPDDDSRETPDPRPPAERDITEGYRPPSKPQTPTPEAPEKDD